MLYRVLFLCIRLSLFSLASSAPIALSASNGTAYYQIDVSQRGSEIVSTFKSLPPAGGINTPEVALQTTIPTSNAYTAYRYISNGIISYVQSITQTTYNTLLIVAYQAQQFPSYLQYIVVPVEQIVALLYFENKNNLPSSSSPFSAGTIPNSVPYYFVDPKQRAADIVSAVTKLMATPFKTAPTNQVWLQTTLSGPFSPPIPNGLLKNVISISIANNSLIEVEYLPPNQPQPLTIVLTPEQVLQINYVLNLNSP